jgi:hypothetical protein
MSDTKKTSVTEDVLRKAAKSTLDNSTTRLDDDVRQRLQQARRAAIRAATSATGQPSRLAVHPSRAVAAGSFAVLALVASVVFYQYRSASEPSPMASIEDMPILTAPEELELYEELDFYQWLAEEQDSVG